MQRDDGIARSKLGQISIGFGHIGFDNVHHSFTKRNVLNVQQFKVHAATSFSLVHGFSQQIRHSIPHGDTARHIEYTCNEWVGSLTIERNALFKLVKHQLQLMLRSK